MPPLTPEQQAREEIDRQLTACGWLVQNHKAMNIMADPRSKAAKRAIFKEILEGFEALKRRRDV